MPVDLHGLACAAGRCNHDGDGKWTNVTEESLAKLVEVLFTRGRCEKVTAIPGIGGFACGLKNGHVGPHESSDGRAVWAD